MDKLKILIGLAKLMEQIFEEEFDDQMWAEYVDYLFELNSEQLNNEIKFVEELGKAKFFGKNVVSINHFYYM